MWAVIPLTRDPLLSLPLPPCPTSKDPWLAAGVRVTSPRRPSASPARPSRRNSLEKSRRRSGLRFNPLLNVWTALNIRSRCCPHWRRRWPMWIPPSNSSVIGSMTSTAPAFPRRRLTWNKWRLLWHCKHWTLTSIAGNGLSPPRGLKGPADEDDTDTRAACVKLAREHLDIADAAASNFAACHRLSRKADSGVIMRFRDLGMRNLWLSNARFLRGRVDDISISPDLPPVLRSLKTELLQQRKTLAPEEKKRAHIKYLREWHYVELAVGKDRKVHSNVTKETLVKSILAWSKNLPIK